MQRNRYFSTCILVLLCFNPRQLYAANTWSYHQENDRLNNQTYSVTVSPLPRRDLYDELKLEVICRDNALQVAIDADSLIASQGSKFELEYQIDKQAPVLIQMRTFPDSKRRGYTNDEAKRLIDAILTGQEAIFIRVKTMIREVLSGSIPLQDAAKPVQQILSDCGMSATSQADNAAVYRLTDFEREFNQLTSTQQQQVLDQLKKIIKEVK